MHATEAEQVQRELAELRVIYDHLHDTASIAVTAVWLEPMFMHDWLRALPDRVRAVIVAGVHPGAMYGLTAANLQDMDWSIGQIPVRFPRGTRPRRRQESALYFNANADAILLSVDIDALLENHGPAAAS